MQVCIFRPEVQLNVTTVSTPAGGKNILQLFDPTTGFEMVGNVEPDPITLPSGTVVQPHCTHVVTPQDELVPIRSALEFETRLARLTGKATPLEGKFGTIPKDSANDWYDDCKSSHTTSGARRHFISVGFERHLRGLADGLLSIRSWAVCQRSRPVAWWPFVFKYDGFYGKLQIPSGGTWKYDDRMTDGAKDPAHGWGILDPAHVETAILMAGASIGDLECFGHLIFGVAPWLCSTFAAGGPKAFKVQKGWRGSDQERACGRVAKAMADLGLLGIGIGPACAEYRDTFLAGLDPKQHLLGYLRDLEARWMPFGSGKADDRTMVDFKDGSGEIKAWYPWQRTGIAYHDLARVLLHSGLVNAPLRDRLVAQLEADATVALDRAVGAGGVSYGVSRNAHFTQSSALALADPANQSVDKANQLETDKSHVYELDDDDGDGFDAVRDRPRLADAELTAAGVAMLRGHDDQVVQQLLAMLPKPGFSRYTGSMGRSLDVVYAMQERAALAGVA